MAVYTQDIVAELYRARIDAFQDWLSLFRAGDWRTDPQQRGRMLDARGRYQEAVISHAWAARFLSHTARGPKSRRPRRSAA